MQKHILLVEDDESILEMVEKYLRMEGFAITSASNGEEAVQHYLRTSFDLIILDIMMPKLDGWEILQSLRLNEKTRHIPIIVCSAWGESEFARSLGADYFLKKPITQKELLDVLQKTALKTT